MEQRHQRVYDERYVLVGLESYRERVPEIRHPQRISCPGNGEDIGTRIDAGDHFPDLGHPDCRQEIDDLLRIDEIRVQRQVIGQDPRNLPGNVQNPAS